MRVTGRVLGDSNAPRDFSDSQSLRPEADLALSLLGAAEGRVTGERLQLVGRYELGGRKYLALPDGGRAGAGRRRWRARRRWAPSWAWAWRGAPRIGGVAAGTTRTWAPSAFLEYAPDVRLALRRAGGRAPLRVPAGLPGELRRARVGLPGALPLQPPPLAERLRGVRARGATAWRPGPPRSGEGPPLGRRKDGALSAGASYTYRGPVALGLTYTFQEISSNSFGETVLRHRLSGSAGLRLPWNVTLLAQGALGLSRYPDGIFLSPEIILVEEDEGQNSLSLKLARPGERAPGRGAVLRPLQHPPAAQWALLLHGRWDWAWAVSLAHCRPGEVRAFPHAHPPGEIRRGCASIGAAFSGAGASSGGDALGLVRLCPRAGARP